MWVAAAREGGFFLKHIRCFSPNRQGCQFLFSCSLTHLHLSETQDGGVVCVFNDIVVLCGDTVVCLQGNKFVAEMAALQGTCANCDLANLLPILTTCDLSVRRSRTQLQVGFGTPRLVSSSISLSRWMVLRAERERRKSILTYVLLLSRFCSEWGRRKWCAPSDIVTHNFFVCVDVNYSVFKRCSTLWLLCGLACSFTLCFLV